MHNSAIMMHVCETSCSKDDNDNDEDGSGGGGRDGDNIAIAHCIAMCIISRERWYWFNGRESEREPEQRQKQTISTNCNHCTIDHQLNSMHQSLIHVEHCSHGARCISANEWIFVCASFFLFRLLQFSAHFIDQQAHLTVNGLLNSISSRIWI